MTPPEPARVPEPINFNDVSVKLHRWKLVGGGGV